MRKRFAGCWVRLTTVSRREDTSFRRGQVLPGDKGGREGRREGGREGGRGGGEWVPQKK